jgi:sortase A
VTLAGVGIKPSPPTQEQPLWGFTPPEETLTASEEPLPLPRELSTESAVLYPNTVRAGDYLGTISLPSLALTWPIFEGTSESELSQGVGHFVGSVMPGVQDNTVLSGHRTTVFGALGELAEGDLIFVATTAGHFTYQVRSFQIVPRTNTDVIVPTPGATLTLTTCHPFTSPVHTTDAFVVTADLIGSQAHPPPNPPGR